MSSEKKVPDIETQWDEWRTTNTKIDHIDQQELKERLMEDLSYVSQMDVKEYTLYQKWLEVKEKYPVETVSTLFGDEVQMTNADHKKLIETVKKNFWKPESPDDYERLQPIMVLSNGELAETWNTIRTFSSTMKNNSNIGRNLY
jgi:hypothetical protein